MSESIARREKRQPIPSGSAGTAPPPPRFPVGFSYFLWGRGLVCGGAQRRRSRHRQAHAELPLYSFLNLMVLSVLPDIGAVFIADAEFTIIHTGFRHAEHFYDFGTFPTKMKCL